MQVGTALQAPEGYRSLEAEQTYHFLRSNRATGTVLILLFAKGKRWLAHLYTLPSTEFEKCLLDGSIIEISSSGQPPFFDRVQGKNLFEYDLTRRNVKQPHADRIEARMLNIAPLLESAEQILNAPDPEKEINKYANAKGLNRQRVRFWFFTYLCFGRDSWMLFPHYFNCGHWNRLQQSIGRKFGRPSIARGKQSGHRLNEQEIDLIVKSYMQLRDKGKPLKTIYTEAARKHFKAGVSTNEHGQMRLISSDGKSIPTFNQYRYQLIKAVGLEEIQRWRWGDSKYRRSKAAHKGTFTSSASNLLERIEADAYYSEKPRGIHGEALPPLAIARVVDTASGLRLGIGFAFNKENSAAYDAANFCSAISKQKFCRLFGIEISEDEWPSQGLSPHYITDRGPGIKPEPGHEQQPGLGMVIREITPSGQGQSKANVESAQRRRTRLEGLPQETLSDLSVYEMAVREIRRVLAENQASDVSGRMTPEMVRDRIMPNPLGVWDFLNSRARNDSQLINFDDAVRRFLPETTVRVGRDGVWLRSQRYDSQALRNTKLLERVSSIGTQKIKAYYLPICVRHIWVAVNNQLIEVDAQLNLRDDEEMLYRSYHDLLQENNLLRQGKAELKQHGLAATVDQKIRFKKENDAEWHAGRTTHTRSKRSRATREEEKEIQAIFKGAECEDEA